MSNNINKGTLDKVLVLDFGGQYNQLIARRVREMNVYCEVHPFNWAIEDIKAYNPKAIIFTGGPSSVYNDGSPKPNPAIFSLNIPILGICYGAQIMAYSLGGEVVPAPSIASREYGKTETSFDKNSLLFKDIPSEDIVWMSHGDSVQKLPEGFKPSAKTLACPYAAFENPIKKFYAVQFHPEVNHTVHGFEILKAFVLDVAKASPTWTMANFMKTSIQSLKEKKSAHLKRFLLLSGGVDSSVAAALMSQAIGKNLTCVFVDHGLLRKDEGDQVETVFSKYPINFIRVDAKARFLEKLSGVTDPERKRKIIGEEFIRVFEETAKSIGIVNYLVQGTIYPDVIESGLGNSAVIKSHHNVGGLPSNVDFKGIVEPLRLLFKDEVRRLGVELGLPSSLVNRQPFPGPGLAIRVIGEVTEEKLSILREADWIFRSELESFCQTMSQNGISIAKNQYFAVLTNIKSVGVMGDSRTYDYTIALRSVETSDFMTASISRIPYEILEKVSNRIVNEVPHVNRVVYDITSKPPATIEWE